MNAPKLRKILTMKLSILFVLSLSLLDNTFANEELSVERQEFLNNLLVQDCGSCHGLQLKGGLGPALLADRLKQLPASFITRTILDGRPGTAMPPWNAILSIKDAQWMTTRLQSGGLQ